MRAFPSTWARVQNSSWIRNYQCMKCRGYEKSCTHPTDFAVFFDFLIIRDKTNVHRDCLFPIDLGSYKMINKCYSINHHGSDEILMVE